MSRFHLPIAYHGRASSVVISGTDIIRPRFGNIIATLFFIKSFIFFLDMLMKWTKHLEKDGILSNFGNNIYFGLVSSFVKAHMYNNACTCIMQIFYRQYFYMPMLVHALELIHLLPITTPMIVVHFTRPTMLCFHMRKRLKNLGIHFYNCGCNHVCFINSLFWYG